jgi:hypothetical protein
VSGHRLGLLARHALLYELGTYARQSPGVELALGMREVVLSANPPQVELGAGRNDEDDHNHKNDQSAHYRQGDHRKATLRADLCSGTEP